MEKFKLFHVALYAKGWYEREKNQSVWDDLKVILSLDDYSGEVMSKHDITTVILSHCQHLKKLRQFTDLTCFVDGINPNNSWKYGYSTKGNTPFNTGDESKLPDYDFNEAILRYCLSSIKNTETVKLFEDGRLPKPDYEKGLPRAKNVTNEMLAKSFPDEKKVITVKLDWSNVFNTKQWLKTLDGFSSIGEANKKAKSAGYPYFMWNEVVYVIDGDRLDCTEEDINADTSKRYIKKELC